jgi:hypothetical protein
MQRILQIFIWVYFSVNVFAQSNQYLHFDGVNDHVRVENASQFISGSNGISMTGWFKSDDLAYGRALMSFRGGGSGTGEMYLIRLNNGLIEARFISTAGFHEVVAPAGTMQTGVWQHVAWVYTGTHVRLYVDGNLIGQNAASGTITSTNRPFTIGRSILTDLNFYFHGGIDEVTLWSKGLSENEILDIIDDELTGNEEGLELYYKFNQGIPGGNNTSISSVVSEIVGNNNRNGSLLNFSLQGETSNFVGELEDGFQSITFYEIQNKVISSEPFEILAEASSGLPVEFELISGPASVNGNLVTLTGAPGVVMILAKQDGDSEYDAASPIVQSFNVVDPLLVVPDVDLRNPANGELLLHELGYVQLAAISTTDYDDVLSVEKVEFIVNDVVIEAHNYGNNHFTAWWLPEAFGNQTITVKSYNNFGGVNEMDYPVFLGSSNEDIIVNAATNVWLNSGIYTIEVESELPSFLGTYDQIIAKLNITCPPGGCDPWDRVSSIEIKGHDGEWYEIIRYLTPYGVPCSHEIDLTDFTSLLQGKVRFRFTLETFGNGFYYTLNFDYKAGNPEFLYSRASKLWYDTYPFGDYANLQPTEEYQISLHDNTEAARIKLVSTGHGWGNNNTSNAAEFFETSHQIRVNNITAFMQHNWNVCNPNPDGCSPQNGTWYHNRAGWCPGAIAPWFSFDLANYLSQGDFSLRYVLNQNYVDLCHPNHPNCVTGVTCPDCNDGFNPHLIVASYLIEFGNNPFDDEIVGIDAIYLQNSNNMNIAPKPASNKITISFDDDDKKIISITDLLGRVIGYYNLPAGRVLEVDVSAYEPGYYLVKCVYGNGSFVTDKIAIIR